MNGRDLIQKILNTKVYGYEADVIIRTPDYQGYKNCDIRVINIDGRQVIVVDLIDEPLATAGSDFDLDKVIHYGHPVEDNINLALDVTIARQNVQIYNNNTYPQIEEIDKIIIERSKQGFDYYELVLDENGVYLDNDKDGRKGSHIADVINKHYSSLGFDVCVDKIKDKLKVLIQW